MRDYFAQHRVLPSYAGLSQVLGFQGKAGAFKLAHRLVAAGYLEQAPGGKLVPGGRFFGLSRVDDKLPAGTGEAAAWSGGIETHELDRLLVKHPSRTILVPIRGDSMIEIGVLDGDTAVVERTENARAGDFVAALVDGQCTVKELRYERSRPVLVPHNRQYEIIRPQQDLLILGVVTGIVRRYDRPGGAARARGVDP